jgi:intracellular sulfur oxidation DsrE/DsrF family protein
MKNSTRKPEPSIAPAREADVLKADSPIGEATCVTMLTTQGVEVVVPRNQVAHFKAKNYTVK